MRELKRGVTQMVCFWPCRTPPGVRELKLHGVPNRGHLTGRTPPGVRELKLGELDCVVGRLEVAPLPGCVN